MYNQFICGLFLLIAASSTYAAAIKGSERTCISDHSCLVSVLTDKRICTGALIDSKTVVTSATCLAFYDASQLKVAVYNDTKIIKIAGYSFNPYFDFVTMENDIGILKLAESVDASYVELPKKEPASGSKGVLINWDADNAVEEFAETILNVEDCAEKSKYDKDELFASMMCAFSENSDGCVGSPGSPLVSNNQLVGLLSGGYGCGNKKDPAIFTNTASQLSWLEKKLYNL